MSKKIINSNIDPMFDGHLEKPLSKMTSREKLYYLWLQMEFKYSIRNGKIMKKEITNKQDSSK
jgi:hypothetical protein